MSDSLLPFSSTSSAEEELLWCSHLIFLCRFLELCGTSLSSSSNSLWPEPTFHFDDFLVGEALDFGVRDHVLVLFPFWLSSSRTFAVTTFFQEDFQDSDMTEAKRESDREPSIFM